MTQPATKLFREEAKTGAIECPACGTELGGRDAEAAAASSAPK